MRGESLHYLESIEWSGGSIDRPKQPNSNLIIQKRTYVSQDVIRRVLEGHCGRAVFFVMGVTDVDDKIIARAQAR